ncbi:seven-hairpin glycosidase [Terfezia boudieri ATCC MYA-4762]|uniref:alpha-1,2-Mannosidase n=1 Tax=Terfezia boudieri ATCC MYA-4762 TaxID=1051890 RepID=A0A3N4LF09_9PEZI|nr:seven-hairpin glycosidase [Terfezia boudieri ATCC MYA-4762]
MFRLRRYQLVPIFTFIFCLLVWHLPTPNKLQHEFEPVQLEFNLNTYSTTPSAHKEHENTSKFKSLTASDYMQKPVTPIEEPSTPTKTTLPKTATTVDDLVGVDKLPKLEMTKPKPQLKVHWRKEGEHFPVPPELIVKLPTAQSSLIPKVQATFAQEGEEKRLQRLKRRAAVKVAFEHSWKGYREYAWGHDELAPKTKSYREKFGGWGATLVDALDTMWIMGLKKEFEEALEFVEKLDFTYSAESQIPVFETTIRYLGGLLGAYDVSEHRYPVLLEKAKQLGDILFGVFDTPNRMPILHYYWKPDQVVIPTRAASRSSLAEMGTLALEFTRLAQLTGNHSYFDAIQRITDQLEAIQYITSMPGMWPSTLDASGNCMPPPGPVGRLRKPTNRFVKRQDMDMEEKIQAQEKQGIESKAQTLEEQKPENMTQGLDGQHTDRQKPTPIVAEYPSTAIPPPSTSPWAPFSPPVCTPEPLLPIPYSHDEYTLGAASDSFYEYLLKMHILLEGATEQYAKLYESTMKVARNLFFRPMMPEDPDILVSGAIMVRPDANNTQSRRTDTSHLACFTGGMLALGAMALDLKGDLELGRKLTDGCVTLYNIMPSGVMPEQLDLIPCKDLRSCPWDEEAWLQALLPGVDLHSPESEPEPEKPVTPVHKGPPKKEGAGGDDEDDNWEYERGFEALPGKGSEGHVTGNNEIRNEAKLQEEPTKSVKTDSPLPEDEDYSQQHTKRDPQRGPPPESYKAQLTPIQKAWSKVKQDRLPPGVTFVKDSRYMLRPEAIESVYIMYRITGDKTWLDKGWKMFQSTVEIARTDVAFAEIPDTTRTPEDKEWRQTDSMESFWLAETLKYYYLLFSEPELISLDEWVFNTEAHPFKRGGK